MNSSEYIQRVTYRLKGDRRFAYYDDLKKNLALTRSQLVSLQNKAIHDLVVHAYENTEYYHALFDDNRIAADSIRSKKDLLRIPPLTKTLIRENTDKLRSNDRFGKSLTRVTSGGSTGQQAVVYKSQYFTQMSRAVWLRNNLLAGWNPGDKTAWLWGAPYEHATANASIFARLGIFVNRSLLLNAYRYSPSDFEAWVKRMVSFQPATIYGYAKILLEFAKFLNTEGVSLPSVQRVVSTTETLCERDVIEEAFGCDVYDQYGCREILAIGMEYPKGIMRVADDVVVLNSTPNGEFLITALHSYGFPLINYKLGDCGELSDVIVESEDKTGHLPFSVLNLRIGRITDYLLTKDGKTVSSSAFATYLSTFDLGVVEHQVVQNDYTRFTLRYVPTAQFSYESYSETVASALKYYFGEKLFITYQCVDKIPVEKSGKTRMFKREFELD